MAEKTYIGAPGIAVEKKPIRAARFLISDELLHSILKLPAGCSVKQMTYNHEKYAYELTVVGDDASGLPIVTENSGVPIVTPHYKEDYASGKGPEFAGW